MTEGDYVRNKLTLFSDVRIHSHALSSLRLRRFPTNRRQAFVALAPFLTGGGLEKSHYFFDRTKDCVLFLRNEVQVLVASLREGGGIFVRK